MTVYTKSIVFGCGYVGRRVADAWSKAGRKVYALTRCETNANELLASGIHPIIGNVAVKDSIKDFPNVDTVLYAIGMDRSQPHSVFDVYVDGLARTMDALPDSVRRIIYVSSTGVYSQTDDQWIDETSQTNPTRDGGKACLQAEQLLLSSRFADRAVILRFAGIYGPGRVPQRNLIEENVPLQTDPDSFLNLIHVDDGVKAILAAESLLELPQTILVADNEPVARKEYYAKVAELYKAPMPKFETPSKATLRTLRGGTSKRICNAKLRSLLDFEFDYPTFREGLAASLE